MARKNSKQTRNDSMSQRDIRRLEKAKKNKNPRKDNIDWTDRVLKKLTQGEPDA
jgi:hypothetical protein